ncbi:MAG: acylphosphatase [Phycisphaerales bacterium]
MSDAIRKTIRYVGHVQGVGFRWTAQRIAGGYDVTGYVMNLDDGNVELVVEGPRKEIDAMLAELAQTMARRIHDTKTDTAPATGEFRPSGFVIRH